MSLEEASRAKLDGICQRLDLSPTDHLLEIGTGWGGLAIHAAEKFGCRVTTTNGWDGTSGAWGSTKPKIFVIPV